MKHRLITLIISISLFSLTPIFIEFAFIKISPVDYWVDFDNFSIEEVNGSNITLLIERTAIIDISADYQRLIYSYGENRSIVAHLSAPNVVLPQGHSKFIFVIEEDLPPGQYYMEVNYMIKLPYGINKPLSIQTPVFMITT